MSKTFLDCNFTVELISWLLVKKMSPQPLIFQIRQLHNNLANNNLTILIEYIKIPINIKGVDVMIKVWLINVKV